MRPARPDPIFAGLNPAAAAFEFAVVRLTLAGFALLAVPAEIEGNDWRTFAILLPIIAAVLADRAAYRAKFSGWNSVPLPPDGDPVDEAERVLLDASR